MLEGQKKIVRLRRAFVHLPPSIISPLNRPSAPPSHSSPRLRPCVAPTFEQKRKSKRKRHSDELAEDSRLTDPEDCFRINVIYAVLDIVNS